MWKLSRSEWHLMLWITIFSIFFSAFSLTLLAVFFFSGVWKVTAAEGGGEKSHPITFFFLFDPIKLEIAISSHPPSKKVLYCSTTTTSSEVFKILSHLHSTTSPSSLLLQTRRVFLPLSKILPQLTSFFIPLNPTTRQNPIPKLKHFDDTGTHQIYTRRSFDWNKFFFRNPEKCECEMCVLCEGGSSKRKIVS